MRVGVSVPVGVELGVKVGVGVGAPQVASLGISGSRQTNEPPTLTHSKVPEHSLLVSHVSLHSFWVVASATVIVLEQTAELVPSETVAVLLTCVPIVAAALTRTRKVSC